MNWFYWLLVVAGSAFAVFYFFFPGRIVALVVGLVRNWGRMSVQSVLVNGVTWPYLEGGPATGDTLVMLHGFAGDKDNWSL